MRHLIIRNIGPIKEVNIDLNRFNFIIGPQCGGKSTVAKILSTCSWVEKEVATTLDEHAVATDEKFLNLMVEFHKMTDYFNEESVIYYETDVVVISMKGKEVNIHLKDQDIYRREKICYIPSERNSVTLPELQGLEFGPTNLRSFLFDWFKAREFYGTDNKTDILDLGVKYYYDPTEKKDKDRVEHINGKTYTIPLGSASSGLQSVVPLQIMMQYYSGHYFNTYAEKTSFDSDAKMRLIQSRVIDRYVLSVAFPGYDPSNRRRLIEIMNDRIHNGDPDARRLLSIYRAETERLTVPVRTSYIIEEPEQNLFPATQIELLYFLLSIANQGRRHRVFITTHSPYILFALNNCILASIVHKKSNPDIAEAVKSVNFAIDPKEVSVWSIKDGYFKNEDGQMQTTIQDGRGLVRKNYFNDVMHQVMKDFNLLLEFDD